MAPILFNAAASLASDVINGIVDRFSHHSKPDKIHQAKRVNFGDMLSNSQPLAAIGSSNAPQIPQSMLIERVLRSPEVTTALGGADPTRTVQVEMSATGELAVRGASGDVRELKASDHTRALVAGLYWARRPGTIPGAPAPAAILAVDPTHAVAPAWSTLPSRNA